MPWNYILRSIEEMVFLVVVVAGLHLLIEYLTGVHIVSRVWHDLVANPIPAWTWPTWLCLAIAVSVAALEIIYQRNKPIK
jgi:hypothetical protein